MVACYNNLAGNNDITQYNPNLTLVDYATSNGNSEISSNDQAVGMGILSDLLEWHKLDPVDEYEIHRNNLIYNNFQHNRNPFIDFPEWVDLIWGNDKGSKSASPSTDVIYEGRGTTPAKPSEPDKPATSDDTIFGMPKQRALIIGGIALGVVVVIVIIILIVSPKARKKAGKAVKKSVKKQVKKSAKKKK